MERVVEDVLDGRIMEEEKKKGREREIREVNIYEGLLFPPDQINTAASKTLNPKRMDHTEITQINPGNFNQSE